MNRAWTLREGSPTVRNPSDFSALGQSLSCDAVS